MKVQNTKSIFVSILFKSCPVVGHFRHHVGPRDQSHGVLARYYRIFIIYGYCPTCRADTGVFGVRYTLAVALLGDWSCDSGQHRRLLAARNQPAHQEAHTQLQGNVRPTIIHCNLDHLGTSKGSCCSLTLIHSYYFGIVMTSPHFLSL